VSLVPFDEAIASVRRGEGIPLEKFRAILHRVALPSRRYAAVAVRPIAVLLFSVTV
jgi:hypothetical protein